MKVMLYHNLIVDNGGLPKLIRDSEEGIALPDHLVIQYEQTRAAYVAARDNLIDAYRKAGGTYNG
jgi:hypothetical protein